VNRRDDLAAQLREVRPEDLAAWMEARSGLPGPRGNLELVAAAGDVLPIETFLAWAAISAPEAPYGTSREFLPVVGVAGLGRALVEAADDTRVRDGLLGRLHGHATDPRWRVREAVAIGLQRWGVTDMPALLAAMRTWAVDPERLVQRAAVAALCEPPLLRDGPTVVAVLSVLDTITGSVPGATDRRSDPFRVLRQALGYGWSVAIASAPVPGWAAFDRWLASGDPDIRWIVRQNQGKRRMPPRPAA
jgi:hypothetical protein